MHTMTSNRPLRHRWRGRIFGLHTLILASVLGFFSPLHAQNSPTPELDPNDSLLVTVSGTVQISRNEGANWLTGRTNMVLKTGNRVRTGRRSRATIQMSDKTILRVRQLSTLVIQPPRSAQDKAEVDLRSGSGYFFSRERPTEIRFRTSITSGAIRGTEFDLTVKPDGTTEVTMLDGEVFLENEHGSETIVSGERGTVVPGSAPTKTAVINALNTVQWSLYYPGILHLPELTLPNADAAQLQASLAAYRSGDLLGALAALPENFAPTSAATQAFIAATELAGGETSPASNLSLNAASDPQTRDLIAALKVLLAAVQNRVPDDPGAAPTTASHWLAHSYLAQAQHDLDVARNAVNRALEIAPDFGYAWVRLGELEFGFGRTKAALAALEKAEALSAKNAQLHALRGFVLLANDEQAGAEQAFNTSIELDGNLGNAWLGRGLLLIQRGNKQEGRLALQTAAVLEPQRALLRSYLGKAYSHERLNDLALRDLERAQDLDPNDPTAWLYSALVKKEENRVNEAVDDLKTSQLLNDNRALFRSRSLLDQDQAIRSANLASIYRDAGMFDLSRREASRAVDYDITSPSAHLFLASSYDSLRDPKQINLRYETPFASELFLANLLSPVGAAPLSQNISQHEYSRLFDRTGFGLANNTEYFSNGDWQQTTSQFGNFDDFSYALDVDYRTEIGQRPNNDFERFSVWAKAKFNLTKQDSILIQTVYSDYESGDVAQYYDQATASTTQRVEETQEPLLFVGYHREWHPGSHTLFLASRFDDTLNRTDPAAVISTLSKNGAGAVTGVTPLIFDLDYQRELEGYSAELQHLLKSGSHSFIVGSRYQWADVDTDSSLFRSPVAFPPIFATPPAFQSESQTLDRFSTYAYYGWDILDNLQVWGGLTYDYLDYPLNSEVPPITAGQESESQLSPKVGLRWNPTTSTTIRGLYTQSLGGVFFDNSIRLEPTQLGGFNHAFRSLIPESVVGLVPGSSFETFGLAWDQEFPTRTYLSVAAEVLRSDADRALGVFEFSALPAGTGFTNESLDFEEQSLQITLDQLIGDDFGVGAIYRLSRAELEQRIPEIPTAVLATADQDLEAILHQLKVYARFNHQSGFYSQVEGIWSQQSNRGYATDLPGDDFFQFNAFAGYRFYQRRAQIQVGILNIGDQDYQLNPLNLYQELPRERMFVASFRFNF